jgi:xanthine dehydrogenase accessory factor
VTAGAPCRWITTPLQLLENDPSDLGLPPDVLVTRARPAGARRPGRRWLLDLCRAHQPQVVLFGAGHVGPPSSRSCPPACRVLWVDEREDMFPPGLPPQIRIEATDVPNAAVDMAEPGAYYS